MSTPRDIVSRSHVVALAVALGASSLAATSEPARAQTVRPSADTSVVRMVVVVSRHGVRSPTDPAELAGYAARPWPAWDVAPGDLTAHGATLMTSFGRAYRSTYAAERLLPATGCPTADSVYVWADVDERTKATGAALLDGIAPNCRIVAHDAGAAVDPLFHALPTVGKADPALATAALAGSPGGSPDAIVDANRAAFARLDAILGCAPNRCRIVSEAPSAIASSAKNGLAGLTGAVDLASTAVEDFILAYADGKPLRDVGWGAVDRATLLELSSLHTLKFALGAELPYPARVQGSNLLAHVRATLDQGATGKKDPGTRAPLPARFVAFVGHDTNLAELAGLLRVHWLMDGYQTNDTPPGGALVFEVRTMPAGAPFVRTFYTAQSLDEMRTLSTNVPQRVPVFVPGCPALDCPISTFDRIVDAAVDPAFVASW